MKDYSIEFYATKGYVKKRLIILNYLLSETTQNLHYDFGEDEDYKNMVYLHGNFSDEEYSGIIMSSKKPSVNFMLNSSKALSFILGFSSNRSLLDMAEDFYNFAERESFTHAMGIVKPVKA
jgi:hypothetical protein